MSNPIVHWEIGASDDSRAHKFYRDTFGWKIDADNPMNYGIVDTGGKGINGGIFKAPKGVPFLTFYVQVDDLPAYLKKIEQGGGQTVVPPQDIPGIGQSAFFKDPDGLIVGLFKPLPGM
jgi:predicted enzyme related to lactoylglutathione lyase